MHPMKPGSDMSLSKETVEGGNTTGTIMKPVQAAVTTDSDFVEFSMRGPPPENVHPLAHQNLIVPPSNVNIEKPPKAMALNPDSELTMVEENSKLRANYSSAEVEEEEDIVQV